MTNESIDKPQVYYYYFQHYKALLRASVVSYLTQFLSSSSLGVLINGTGRSEKKETTSI